VPLAVTAVVAVAVKIVPSPVQETEVTVPDPPPPDATSVVPEKLRFAPSVMADGAAGDPVGFP
jgi:hypothetical protein